MKKLYLFLAVCLMTATSISAAIMADVCPVDGTGKFDDVKVCQMDASSFEAIGELTFALLTESNWYYEDNGDLVNPGGFGAIYLIRINPSSLDDLRGTYTLDSKTRLLEYVSGKRTIYEAQSGSSAVVKMNAKGDAYNMTLHLVLGEDDVFDGTITGICIPEEENDDTREVINSVELEGFDRSSIVVGATWTEELMQAIFSWCRDKEMGDMGYGYECMTKINCDIHHNIFACNNYAAIARTHVLGGPDKVIEAKRVTNIYDNAFFMNAADLQLPPTGGGKWTNVKVAQFEELDESVIPKVEGNFELQNGDSFVNALDQDYLAGFATLKIVSSSSFDPNSAANTYRQAHGMNMQGTETIRVSMYGNRYNFDKALQLFGAKSGYGAQKP